MDRLTEAELDAHDERFNDLIERIYAGDLALLAVVAGEAIDPAVLDLGADAMDEIVTDATLTGATWTIDDSARVRQVRDMLIVNEPPSADARTIAASCRLIFVEHPMERAA